MIEDAVRLEINTRGFRTPSLGKLRALLQAIDPKLEPILKAS